MIRRIGLAFWAAVLALAGGAVHAQEIRCTQIFMNDSERRICGTAELMDLDRAMADLARRVEQHQDTYRSDQGDFRKALKGCKGNEECLTATYRNRIAQLQAVADELPPPTPEEAAELDAGARSAREKWDDQAAARERWVEEEKDKPQPQVPMPQTLEAPAQPPMTEAPVPMADQLPGTAIDPVPAATMTPVSDPATAPTQPAPVPQADMSVSPGWLIFWVVAALAVLWWIKKALEKAFYRCPRCRRWWAGDVKDEQSEYFTAMQTRRLRTTHKNRNHQITGYSEREVREPVTRRKKTEYIECRTCKHEWVQTSIS